MLFLGPISLLVALGGIAMAVATIALAVDYFIYNGSYLDAYIARFQWFLIIGSTVGATILTLLYSEYYGFIPCSLCWLQRIAIYPQALLSIIAYRARDTIHFPHYGIALSIFGFFVASYHYLAFHAFPQSDGAGNTIGPCLADGSNADCATKVIDMFGFITFPLISAVLFGFLIMIYLYQLREVKN